MNGHEFERGLAHVEPQDDEEAPPRITLLGVGNASFLAHAANDTHEDSGVRINPAAVHGRWFVRDGGIRD
jgi:hypothetical protein